MSGRISPLAQAWMAWLDSELQAGREMDERIAVEVMGLCVHEWRDKHFWTDPLGFDLWSTDCLRCGERREGDDHMLGPQSGQCSKKSRTRWACRSGFRSNRPARRKHPALRGATAHPLNSKQ